jgi:methylmalonyl-CoA mutase
MSDTPAPGVAALNLTAEFPAVLTETWEQTIIADLKGADYEKKLVWKTEEGLAVRPYYRAENLPAVLPPRRERAEWVEFEGAVPVDAIDGAVFHEAGATAVQELGYALAAASDRMAEGQAVAGLLFAVGSNYFFEIAKLRAARMLFARIAEAYGRPAEVKIYAVTALSNKSIYDPYTNLLRATTESLSAVIGGCDALSVQPAGFAGRLANNVQLILREEAHMDKVADPAGGSYYVEALTDSLAREAWTLFRKVEAEGGFAKAAASVDAAIAASRAAKEKAIASRRRVMVGVNNYPDIQEKELEHEGGISGVEWRLARAIEKIRLRTERHAAATGATPKVLLLKRGDLKMKGARGTFCQNFFGCGGFAIEESESYDGTGAALIVLCSSDGEYLDLAKEVCSKVSVPVAVAGNPKEQLEELKAAGVAGFVHVLSNMVETLNEWQDRLGIGGKEEK